MQKSYTIKYSKGGIYQYADFLYDEGKLIRHTFSPRYCALQEVPNISGLNNIRDILKNIKVFAYNNNAEIYKVNGVLPKYYANNAISEELKYLEEKFTSFINTLADSFFISHILPVLKKRRWKVSSSWVGVPILIRFVKNEWDNVDSQHEDHKLIEYMSYRFLRDVMGIGERIKDEEETGWYHSNNFRIFFTYLSEKMLDEHKVFINLP